VKQLKEKKIKENCIAISFDDGYTDNYFIAKPLLEKYNLPATFFITSNSDQQKEYWWDELAKILLETVKLPRMLSLKINGQPFVYDLAGETCLTEELLNKHRKFIAHNPETLRSILYFKLWELLTPMPAHEQLQFISQLRSWAGLAENSRQEYCCMSSHQIKEISDNSLFDIEGHSESHPALPCHGKEVQLQEILNNKIFLEEIIAKKINSFAYPSGKYDDRTIEILKQLNFHAAFTTEANVIQTHSNSLVLGRFQVNNWNGDQFKQMLLKWADS
jgi:peptidoglycan/xylan/chitin deacetylase (PgdA/CDA1 family)